MSAVLESAGRHLNDAFAADVLQGLARRQKSVPCTWLYDQRGSELFEAITELPEYYPTRSEIALLKAHAQEMSSWIGADVSLIELGSGSSRKTPLLLRAMPTLRSYIPMDIAGDFLLESTAALKSVFPTLPMQPVLGDFSERRALLHAAAAVTLGTRAVIFFPGSTIGNFDAQAAERFLATLGQIFGSGTALLLGVDTTVDPDVLVPAYDDAQGVTAQFNLNLLVRINRELSGDFPLESFRHEARFVEALSRIEMHLVASCALEVSVMGERFRFDEGETIHTENSCKYPAARLEDIAASAGWRIEHTWIHPDSGFAEFGLRRN